MSQMYMLVAFDGFEWQLSHDWGSEIYHDEEAARSRVEELAETVEGITFGYCKIVEPEIPAISHILTCETKAGVLTQDKIDEYNRHPDHCPFCSGDSYTGDQFDVIAPFVYQVLHCNDCVNSWQDVYEFRGMEVVL